MKFKQLLHRLWYWLQPGKHCHAFCPACDFFEDCEWETTHQNEEYRCEICKNKDSCPAFNTGVIHPCPYFEEEDNHGQEKQQPEYPDH